MRVAFTGRKGSGKTTAARSLAEWGNWRVMSFADPIKDLAVQMTNVAVRDTWRYHEMANRDGRNYLFTRDDLERNKTLFRPFLQWLGTEFGRDFLGNSEIWNWHMEDRIDGTVNAGYHIAIDDLRFPNEETWARRERFLIVRITRDGVDTTDMHPSEVEIDAVSADVTIPNNGTAAELSRAVAAVVADAAVPEGVA